MVETSRGEQGDLERELQLSALTGIRWILATGLALLTIFAGSHPHVEVVVGLPRVVALPVLGVVGLGVRLQEAWIWFVPLVVLSYAALERSWLVRQDRRALAGTARVLLLVLGFSVVALNVPLLRVIHPLASW